MSRSEFAFQAFRAAVAEVQERELDHRHRKGYERWPVMPGEFDSWEEEPSVDVGPSS